MESRRKISRRATTSTTQPSGSQYTRPNAFPNQQQPAFVTPQSTPAYANPSMPPPGFGSDRVGTSTFKTCVL